MADKRSEWGIVIGVQPGSCDFIFTLGRFGTIERQD
jgi:hypothetical protein